MPVQPLPIEDDRHEELSFKDGSWLTLSGAMRAENPRIYAETCGLAVSRKFPSVIDANKKLAFPPPAPAKSFK
jgi:hypothetical protein